MLKEIILFLSYGIMQVQLAHDLFDTSSKSLQNSVHYVNDVEHCCFLWVFSKISKILIFIIIFVEMLSWIVLVVCVLI